MKNSFNPEKTCRVMSCVFVFVLLFKQSEWDHGGKWLITLGIHGWVCNAQLVLHCQCTARYGLIDTSSFINVPRTTCYQWILCRSGNQGIEVNGRTRYRSIREAITGQRNKTGRNNDIYYPPFACWYMYHL